MSTSELKCPNCDGVRFELMSCVNVYANVKSFTTDTDGKINVLTVGGRQTAWETEGDFVVRCLDCTTEVVSENELGLIDGS